MKFTEDTRVKIAVLLHLIRLGYSYLSLKTQTGDKETNIFLGGFASVTVGYRHAIQQSCRLFLVGVLAYSNRPR
ncbi:Uncharacterised protein [Serratia quinivorans]|nr:Uncharacterised protein [Serratia quinivorans]